MLGTALQFGDFRGEDRFYIPVKARKNQNQRKQAQRDKSVENEAALKSQLVASEDRNLNESSNSSNKPSSCPSVGSSNIDRFLESTTPIVPVQYFSKTTMRGWKTCDVEYLSYFSLNDLWESFREWSAYGAGVPLLLDGRESVVQYYVPYLSAIQLYGQSAKKSNAKPRYTGEDSDGDYYRDSSSDASSDSEFGKRTENFIAQSSQYRPGNVSFQMSSYLYMINTMRCKMGFLAMTVNLGTLKIFFLSILIKILLIAVNHWLTRPVLVLINVWLIYRYFEQSILYFIIFGQILDLAHHYPSLKSLRSCDLLPSSWLSVAWYPIYRIPTGPTLKDLDACFLTYHTPYTLDRKWGCSGSNFAYGWCSKDFLTYFCNGSLQVKGIYMAAKWS
ncbi:uncharacterized protein LOC130738849 isoform X2 [Lotus japonicus]|uniref:uncharacterized protein LOC130738849 isoform X2 n=1 Tax=Lotus japonicus TaxID=34305 RepID=UPI002584FC96|nr:uncharacterized protein LOC130738849 isoform X2 [Lotus japonicus]